MKKNKKSSTKNRWKGKIPEKQARLISFIIILPVAFLLLYKLFAYVDKNSISAQQFVDLQQGSEVYPGYRRAHAKGMCVTGVFESSGGLSQYSTANVLQAGEYPFVGRFSISGNNPSAPDLDAPVRSFALSLSDIGQIDANSQNHSIQNTEWRIAMNTPPVMPVASPEAFYAQLQALAPNPETQQADPNKIKAFFAAHPESQAFLAWKSQYQPTNSFADETYHSVNAFYLEDADNKQQAVRWQFTPSKEQSQRMDKTPDANNPDALQEQLKGMLAEAPIEFEWQFTLANEEDDESNPSIAWPESRKSLSAGTIVVTNIASDDACQGRNFDPLVLPKGVSATADPILRARSAAYAESFRRRAKEVLFGAKSYDSGN